MDNPATPWPTAESFAAADLRQYRVEGYDPRLLLISHIGTCGFSATVQARRLDLLASTAAIHAASCDGTGNYPRVADPDPWAVEGVATQNSSGYVNTAALAN